MSLDLRDYPVLVVPRATPTLTLTVFGERDGTQRTTHRVEVVTSLPTTGEDGVTHLTREIPMGSGRDTGVGVPRPCSVSRSGLLVTERHTGDEEGPGVKEVDMLHPKILQFQWRPRENRVCKRPTVVVLPLVRRSKCGLRDP